MVEIEKKAAWGLGEKAEEETSFDDFVYKAIIVACIIGIIVILALVTVTKEEDYFSAVYFKPESYSNYLEDNKTSFVYGIENHEKGDEKYNIKFYANDSLLKEQSLLVGKDGKVEEPETLSLKDLNLSFPIKLKMAVKVNEEPYEVHYWISKRD